MAIVISGNGIDMGGNPVSNASQIEVQQEQVSPFNGFKNYIINGKKVVNQRKLTSTDNSYNQDRWYKAGNNWYQGIEGDNNLISGKTYTLSWEGTAIASYYVGTATSATINSQTFTPISNGESFTLTIAAGQNLWIKFTSDATGSTFNFVQLEEGSVATPFEHRPYGLELSLCQRYFYRLTGQLYSFIANGMTCNTNKAWTTIQLPVALRVQPTVSFSNIGAWNSYGGHFGTGATSVNVNTYGKTSDNLLGLSFSGISGISSQPLMIAFSGNGYLNIDAEL